jgi:hypothetical protein
MGAAEVVADLCGLLLVSNNAVRVPSNCNFGLWYLPNLETQQSLFPLDHIGELV